MLLTKGAPEMLLQLCNTTVCCFRQDKLVTKELDDSSREDILGGIQTMAQNGLHCVGFCYRELDWYTYDSHDLDDNDHRRKFFNKLCNSQMTWIGVIGLKDEINPQVPQSVLSCQDAGVIVRMLTGDHLETSKYIGAQCNIMTSDQHIAMEASEFRALTEVEQIARLPMLRILARATEEDKNYLVRLCMKQGEIVMATGCNGYYDCMTLSEANIGLFMGKNKTDVAKMSSDVIIMDNNFDTICKGIMLSRNVYDNVRKYIQFEFCLWFVLFSLILIATFYEHAEIVLNGVQLVWIDIIMNSMAVFALATEDAIPIKSPNGNRYQVLKRLPFDEKHISQTISPKSPMMTRFIFGHGLFQLGFLLFTLFCGQKLFDINDSDDSDDAKLELVGIVFNLFVWFEIFNLINARSVNNEMNVFKNIFSNYYFTKVVGIMIIVQLIYVIFGEKWAGVVSLNYVEWLYCVFGGATSIIWNQILLRLIPVNVFSNHLFKPINTEMLFKRDQTFIERQTVHVVYKNNINIGTHTLADINIDTYNDNNNQLNNNGDTINNSKHINKDQKDEVNVNHDNELVNKGNEMKNEEMKNNEQKNNEFENKIDDDNRVNKTTSNEISINKSMGDHEKHGNSATASQTLDIDESTMRIMMTVLEDLDAQEN